VGIGLRALPVSESYVMARRTADRATAAGGCSNTGCQSMLDWAGLATRCRTPMSLSGSEVLVVVS